jgi:hypothetical protein
MPRAVAGGSTEEAQAAIGAEVGETLIRYITTGSSMGAVNFPEVDIRPTSGRSAGKVVRIINCHRNVPGVLKQINRILSDFNIEKQTCDSRGNLAYLIAEMRLEDSKDSAAICKSIAGISGRLWPSAAGGLHPLPSPYHLLRSGPYLLIFLSCRAPPPPVYGTSESIMTRVA